MLDKLLPVQEGEGNAAPVIVNGSLTKFLKGMRYGNDETESTRSRKKMLNIPTGRS